MTFEQLEIGDKFKVIGKITRKPSQYTWEKIDTIVGQDQVPYNAKTMIGPRGTKEHYGSFWPTDEVETQK